MPIFKLSNTNVQGTHTLLLSTLQEQDIEAAEALGTAWYRSREVFPQDMPYAGYLANKKWPLAEECCKSYSAAVPLTTQNPHI